MKYPLASLLYIREMREGTASKNLTKAKRHLEDMIQKVIQKRKELEDYKVWRVEEEQRIYDEIIDTLVKRVDLDDVKAQIAHLRKKELDYAQAIEDAKIEREEAKDAVEEARRLYNEAIMNRKKIDEHKSMWAAEWSKEKERLADLEMEEFRTPEFEF